MSRVARETSSTGMYHVMLRGIDTRDLFLKDPDYQKFIYYMRKAKENIEFAVYAYSLMTNHVHMLIKTQPETKDLGEIVKRITVGYAQYHNAEYGRMGHLFQNRFRSEVVDNEASFLAVLRYIHQNPMKAGLAKGVHDYKWSSYNEYFKPASSLIEPVFVLGLFKDSKHFAEFNRETNEDKALDDNPIKRITDKALKEVASSMIDINALDKLDKPSRDKMLREIKDSTQASNRQMARVLNIGRGILDRLYPGE